MSKMLKVVGASWLQTKISSYILGILGLLAILALFAGHMERSQEDGTYAATVFYSEKTGYRIEYWGQSNELAQISKGVARAYFRMDIDTIGWSILEVETDGSYPDEVQAYAAGIVEGALTWYLIHTHLENTFKDKCEQPPLKKQCDKLRDALDRSVNTWKAYAADHDEDPFWHHVSLYYNQINGIYTGWKHGAERISETYEADISDLYWLNYAAEINEIQHKLNISLLNNTLEQLPGLSTSFLRVVQEIGEDGADVNNLLVGQNSAGSYSSMMRIMKRYKLNYHQSVESDSPKVPVTSVEFSGYPGSVTSQDEFYSIKGDALNMAISGTTIRNYNHNLWKDVNITEQVPLGPRLSAANRLATNVSSWGHLLATSNSGTACKQWLAVDFNKLNEKPKDIIPEPGSKSAKKNIQTEVSVNGVNKNIKHTVVHKYSGGQHMRGLVWLIEQVPGRTYSADLSDTLLEQTYWATYGLPFFKDIAEITHTSTMESLYGDIFSYTKSPRGLVFKNGYKNVTDVTTMFSFMRQTNITTNKTKQCLNEVTSTEFNCLVKDNEFWSTLGLRGDITGIKAYGIIDTKIISGRETKTELTAISSPAFTNKTEYNTNNTDKINKGNVASVYTNQFDDENTLNGLEIRDMVKHKQEETAKENLKERQKDLVEPFQWSESTFEDNHDGLPDKWDFGVFKTNWHW